MRSLLDYLLFNTDTLRQDVQINADLVVSLNEELRGKLFSVETLAMMDDLDEKNEVFYDANRRSNCGKAE